MNKVVLVGRLAQDPELSSTTSGLSVCKMTVAVSRPFSKDNATDFIPVTAWRDLGERCAKYLAKGRQCAVSGRIQIDKYTAKDGATRYQTYVVAEDVQFLSPKGEGGSSYQNSSSDDDEGYEKLTSIDDGNLPF